jgi:UDP-N-acetylglucosamine--N-acetylmuramyl-(pentapeptide) pyrophosphoryl-undecaprenol N-acetylglucosamine transferase
MLNRLTLRIAAKLGNRVKFWHQTGNNSIQEVLDAYLKLGRHEDKVTGFIENMAEAYAWSDIAFSRSGSLTVSELADVGLGAIFLPFQHNDQQQ